jgi:hypothetical protein
MTPGENDRDARPIDPSPAPPATPPPSRPIDVVADALAQLVITPLVIAGRG